MGKRKRNRRKEEEEKENVMRKRIQGRKKKLRRGNWEEPIRKSK